MSKIEKRISVNPYVERLFTYMPENYDIVQLWPGLLEVGEVEHLSNGGALAHWLYKMTGATFEELDARSEPLVDHARTSTLLGDMPCTIKWNFHANVHSSQFFLDGDHTYWSMC